MTRMNIDAALAAANPLTHRSAAALSLHEAEVELVERVVAVPVSPRLPRARASVLHRRRLGLLLAVTAAVAAVLAVLPSGRHDAGPTPAFAAPLVRFANASPLVLLQLSGWQVVYADEAAGGSGEMRFVRGAADGAGNPQGASLTKQVSLAGRVASLSWAPRNLTGGTDLAGGHQSLATGLGVIVHRLIYEGGSRRAFDISAEFIYGGRVLWFRATVTDMAMFRDELDALHQVDMTTWLRAMPPSVVRAADSGETIRQMLKGIVLPPGFDAARIRGASLLHDRYQLGAAVTGTVACLWIADWNRAREAGDTTIVRRAIAAMATAPHWPILQEMAREGAWPQALISDAKAMPTGIVPSDPGAPGIPLTRDANAGLGCGHSWGIPLG